jgi:hypothetical protein
MLLLFLALGTCGARHRHRARRGRIRRPNRSPSGPFYPRSVRPDIPSILTFPTDSPGPFFVRVGGRDLGDCPIGERGRRVLQLPGLSTGEHLVQQSSDNVTWVTLGVLRVKPPTNWNAVVASAALIASILLGLWRFQNSATRRKRQKRSDDGQRYEPPRGKVE